METLIVPQNSLNKDVAKSSDDFKTNISEDELKDRINKLKSPQQPSNIQPLTDHDRDVQLSDLESFKAEVTNLSWSKYLDFKNKCDQDKQYQAQIKSLLDRSKVGTKLDPNLKLNKETLDAVDNFKKLKELGLEGFKNKYPKLSEAHPLGKYGDVTLNEVINHMRGLKTEQMFQFLKDHTTELTLVSQMLPTLFIYKSLISHHNKIVAAQIEHIHTLKLSPEQLKVRLEHVTKETRFVKLVAAPFVALGFYVVTRIVGSVKVHLKSQEQASEAIGGNSLLSSSLVLWIKKLNSKHPFNFNFNFFFFIFFFLLSMYLNSNSKETHNFDISFITDWPYFKYVLYVIIISCFIISLYFYVFELFILYLFKSKRISRPVQYPKYIPKNLKLRIDILGIIYNSANIEDSSALKHTIRHNLFGLCLYWFICLVAIILIVIL